MRPRGAGIPPSLMPARRPVVDPRSISAAPALREFASQDRPARGGEGRAGPGSRALAPALAEPLLEARVLVELTAGNLDSARRGDPGAPRRDLEPAALVAYFGNYWDLFWALDDAQQRLLLTLTPAEFDGDRSAWGIVLGQTYWVRGDKARARAYADSSRTASLEVLKVAPDDRPTSRYSSGSPRPIWVRKRKPSETANAALALLPPSQGPDQRCLLPARPGPDLCRNR